MRRFVYLALFLLPALATAQDNSKITLDRIFRQGHFFGESAPDVQWLADGRSYIEADEAGIIRVDITTGGKQTLVPASSLIGANGTPIQIEGMTLSNDESKALLFHNSQRVWRQNTLGLYTIVDLKTGKLTPVAPNNGPMMFAKFSPDNSKVAFVRKNNVYVVDIATGAERALTSDGNANIINGTSDWVYEEEFDLRDGFNWSPDGRRIAFFRFDQTAIPEWTMVDEISSVYPRKSSFKYPKAGAPNSVVRIGVVDVTNIATAWMNTGTDTTVYLPRMEWAGPDSVTIQRLPRKQNRVDFLMASARDGGVRTILTDSDSAYVDVQNPHWIKNGRQFIWMSDRSGWRQYYLYDRSGKLINRITRDGSDVLEIAAVDEARNAIYTQQAAPEAHQRQIFRYSLNGKRVERITNRSGTASWNISPGARYTIESFSSINVPPMVVIRELPSLRTVRVIADNLKLKATIDTLNLAAAELIKLPAADGKTMLDAYRIVPANFDSTKKYPVMMFAYGGPAIPEVIDRWNPVRYMFNQMLAQNGYVVMVVDSRGSAWRGNQFRKGTQYQLGILESDDQIAAAKWIGQQSWGDPARIGLWGWSYGGYLTAMSLFRGGNVFRMGISVAPVGDWRFYDSAYTERFMWLPAENKSGYQEASVLSYAKGLTARYLLIHGTGDDNVHQQNSLAIATSLQMAGKPFYMMMYPNKTHSISGPGGTLHVYDMIARFIKENL